MNKSYSTVDLLKFIFCILIIALHSGVLVLLPDEICFYTTQLVVRHAVPYFFVASGFFLRKKYVSSDKGHYKDVLFSYIKRLLFPFVFFSCIWIWQYWTTYMLEGLSHRKIARLILKDIVFYPHGALWFVQACIVAALLTFPFMRFKNGVNICLIIGTILYVFALLCNNYYFVVDNTRFESIISGFLSFCGSARNGLFVGFIFISLGLKCYDIFIKVQKRSGGGEKQPF